MKIKVHKCRNDDLCYGEFVDALGHRCTIRETGLESGPAVSSLWLGRPFNAQILIGKSEAKALIKLLKVFVKTGGLRRG